MPRAECNPPPPHHSSVRPSCVLCFEKFRFPRVLQSAISVQLQALPHFLSNQSDPCIALMETLEPTRLGPEHLRLCSPSRLPHLARGHCPLLAQLWNPWWVDTSFPRNVLSPTQMFPGRIQACSAGLPRDSGSLTQEVRDRGWGWTRGGGARRSSRFRMVFWS